MERGFSNAQISKTLGIPESTIRYYRKRTSNLEVKRKSKLPKKYINKIYEMASNKTNPFQFEIFPVRNFPIWKFSKFEIPNW